MMEFTFQDDTKVLHKIKVFGIGGGGNNAINNMIRAGVTGPLFVAANSDLQDLERNLAPHKIQVGSQLTKGLGCGGKAEVVEGAKAGDRIVVDGTGKLRPGAKIVEAAAPAAAAGGDAKPQAPAPAPAPGG